MAVSTSAPLIREAALPALAVSFWRNGLGAAALGPSLVGAGARRELARLDGRERRLAMVAGVVLAAHFSTWIPSLSYTTVASSVALVATQPVWAAVIAHVRGHPVPLRAWLGIGLALAGSVALTGVDVRVSSRAFFGDVLALCGGILAAVYVTIGAEVRQTVSTTVYASVCYATAAVVLLVTCITAGASLWGYSAKAWLCLGALVIGPQLLGHTLVNRVLRTLSPTLVSVAILFEVVGASLLAAAWFGEHPQLAAIPAAVMILAGVVLALGAGSQPAAEELPG